MNTCRLRRAPNGFTKGFTLVELLVVIVLSPPPGLN
jgi:type II secretory pathway pseudopilin PulG